MKNTFTQRHPYISAILMGLLCTFMTALGIAVPQIMGLDVNKQIVLTTVFLIISIGMGISIMNKSRFTLADYGFRKSEKDALHKVSWHIPLLAVEIIPIVLNGFSSEVTELQYVILLFFTVAVGFNEEIYFRGLALKFIEEKGRKRKKKRYHLVISNIWSFTSGKCVQWKKCIIPCITDCVCALSRICAC